MKSVALAIALLLGGTALAQTSTSGDMATSQNQSSTQSASGQTQAGWNNTSSQTNMATNAVASTGSIVQPSNANPRRDARGIPVISLAAVVPAGYNGTPSGDSGMGGPLLDPNTGQPVSDNGNYPACTRHTTDKCVQTYERHHRR